MTRRDDHRPFLLYSLLIAALLALAGYTLRSWVARTLAAENKVNLAFLDLSLRDRSRFLGDSLSDDWQRYKDWPGNLNDVLTRNHADYNRDIFMQVFTMRGEKVAESANTPPSTDLAPQGVPQQGWKSHEIRSVDGRPIRLVTYPIYTGLGTDTGITFHGYVQAGLLLPDVERRLRHFTQAMTAGLAGLGSLVLLAQYLSVSAARSKLAKEMNLLHTAQKQFVADAAHELGTPLAVLQGEIDVALRRDRSAEEYRTALLSCREELERLSRLSDNLLTLATTDAGQEILHPSPCDAVELAQRVQRRFQSRAEQNGVSLRLEAPEKLPWKADPVAMEQVLTNLVSNALRHTPAGEVVTLKVSQQKASISFSVVDTGEGIPAIHLPKLFDRFHRVDKARGRHSGGAGLGLAIVKTLVEAHGGKVSVASTVGHGSTFTCILPSDVCVAT